MKKNTIYVLCPLGIKTGGPELLHQLVYQINKETKEYHAVIAYNFVGKQKRVKEFEKYIGNNWINVNEIEDTKDNILIIPETSISFFDKYKNLKKYIWWLSVDNYLLGSSFKYRLENIGLLNAIYAKFKGYIKDYSSQIKQADLNLCQSFYAVDFVKNMGIPKKKIAYLSDYINDLYIKDIKKNNKSHRSNIVLYNPKKGYTFTKKLIKYCQDRKCNWKWVPLINMTNAEVKSYLENCKVYIDFGNHPGKDRFPREAAISGCCIITGKKGAAAYYEDVPIPDQYKFQDIKDNFDSIYKKINECVNNYTTNIEDFSKYRNFILSEKSEFINDCKFIFGKKVNDK